MALADAKKFLLYLDNDDSTPVKTLVEGVENLNVSTGRSLESVVTKSETYAVSADAGFTASADIKRELPMGAGQLLLWATHDADAARKCYIESTETGGDAFEFDARIAIEEIESGPRGQVGYTLAIAADGDVTRSVVS